jgi:hypothetical protein
MDDRVKHAELGKPDPEVTTNDMKIRPGLVERAE